ncbi:MAG: hypothetical protein PUD20_04325 [bacterium]|nr:hypothetical protein [bacterium]
MSSATVMTETQDDMIAFKQWVFEKTVEFEHDKRELEDEKKRIGRQREQLEKERRDYDRQKSLDDHFRSQQEYVIAMKQQILEEELKKLAAEKEYLERQKAFYERVNQFNSQQKQEENRHSTVKGELFFIGVQNERSLKKRYKDLIKIYHPDNADGDTNTLQEINREYDKLRVAFSATHEA